MATFGCDTGIAAGSALAATRSPAPERVNLHISQPVKFSVGSSHCTVISIVRQYDQSKIGSIELTAPCGDVICSRDAGFWAPCATPDQGPCEADRAARTPSGTIG